MPFAPKYAPLLHYSIDGRFLCEYNSISEASTKLGIRYDLIQRALTLRKRIRDIVLIYKPDSGYVPKLINVSLFRQGELKATIKTPEAQKEVIISSIEKLIQRRKDHVRTIVKNKGFADQIIFGISDKDAARLSPFSVIINESLLEYKAETIVDLIFPVLLSNEVSNAGMDLTKRQNVKKSNSLGLTTLQDGFLFLDSSLEKLKHYTIIGRKQCWNCGHFKEAEDFIRSYLTGDGLTHNCKDCIVRLDFLWGSGWKQRHNGEQPPRFPLPRISGIMSANGITSGGVL